MKVAALILALVLASPAAGQVQSPAAANDARAQLARFQPPPPPPPPPSPPQQQAANDATGTTGQPRRRPWRELTDSLLDMMAARALVAGSMLDDPLTTGFGNSDFLEPALRPPFIPEASPPD
jgi:hypothetical protein